MSILVFAENSEGTYKKSSFEAVSYAAQLAQKMNERVVAVSLGMVDGKQHEELARYGADKVVSIADNRLNQFDAKAYAAALAQVASAENSSIVIISNTYGGKSIAPRVAVKLQAGIVSGVVSYPDLSNGFSVRKMVYSGKAFADVNVTTTNKVIAITPNSFTLQTAEKAAEITEFAASLSDSDFGTKSIEVKRVTGKIPLTEAEIVVSGGRGLKGPENWNIIEELADTLGAATACSKPVSDMHWRPHSEHVGQTGITIKPNLYIACGISGAIQHLAGVSSSKVIVAINKDPEAPFFKAADYGIVADVFEVLPKITEAAKKLKAAQN